MTILGILWSMDNLNDSYCDKFNRKEIREYYGIKIEFERISAFSLYIITNSNIIGLIYDNLMRFMLSWKDESKLN